jgi:hypothetical protein
MLIDPLLVMRPRACPHLDIRSEADQSPGSRIDRIIQPLLLPVTGTPVMVKMAPQVQLSAGCSQRCAGIAAIPTGEALVKLVTPTESFRVWRQGASIAVASPTPFLAAALKEAFRERRSNQPPGGGNRSGPATKSASPGVGRSVSAKRNPRADPKHTIRAHLKWGLMTASTPAQDDRGTTQVRQP